MLAPPQGALPRRFADSHAGTFCFNACLARCARKAGSTLTRSIHACRHKSTTMAVVEGCRPTGCGFVRAAACMSSCCPQEGKQTRPRPFTRSCAQLQAPATAPASAFAHLPPRILACMQCRHVRRKHPSQQAYMHETHAYDVVRDARWGRTVEVTNCETTRAKHCGSSSIGL
jgi:hypothetical protein